MKPSLFARCKRMTLPVVCLFVGIIIGGYVFQNIKPRSVLALNHCEKCWRPNQLLGLAGAALMHHFPEGLAPWMEYETDYNVAIRHPLSGKNHYVIITKRDIPHAGDFQANDGIVITDAYAIMQHLIHEKGLDHYRIWSNGKGKQSVNHLHFHLAQGEHMHQLQQKAP